MKVTARQFKLVDAYLARGTVEGAYAEAGYTRRSGASRALLLPHVQEFLDQRRKELADSSPVRYEIEERKRILAEIYRDPDTPATTKIRAIEAFQTIFVETKQDADEDHVGQSIFGTFLTAGRAIRNVGTAIERAAKAAAKPRKPAKPRKRAAAGAK